MYSDVIGHYRRLLIKKIEERIMLFAATRGRMSEEVRRRVRRCRTSLYEIKKCP